MSKPKLTPEEILDKLQEAVDAHEPDSGFIQWYVDEHAIDCDADEFWSVIEETLKRAFS